MEIPATRSFRTTLVLSAAALMALPAVTLAGAPGSADRKAELEHVCKTGPMRGESCDASAEDPCGLKGNGTPHECVLDLLIRPVLNGTLTVIADENPADNVSLPGNPVLTALLELKARGRTYLFSKSYQSSATGLWPEIGAWTPPTSESDIDLLVDSFRYQQPRFALAPFEPAIVEMTETIWPGKFDLTGRIPMIVSALPARGTANDIDQYASADLGEVTRLRVRIQYVIPLTE